jgi:hypothetical protein
MMRLKAIFLLFVFCTSIVGLSAEVHYCKGVLTDISLFGQTDCELGCPSKHSIKKEKKASCHQHQKKQKEACCHKTELKVQEKLEPMDCCSTQNLVNHTTSDFASLNSQLTLIIVVAQLFDYHLFQQELPAQFSFVDYDDPLPDVNLQILHQSFLI